MDKDTAIIVAAFILGVGVLATTFFLTQAVDRTSLRLAAVEGSIEKARSAVAGAAPAAPRPAARQPARGPDPDKVHQIATQGSPRKGPSDARVTLIEFSDFQCPYCSRVGPTLQRVATEYADQVAIVFKHMPLDFHTKARPAHRASEAAHLQGRFWEMHDLVFDNQANLSEAQYVAYAEQLGLDVARFERDMASAAVEKRVEADTREAAKLGVRGTPSFFINGRYFSGAQPFSEFKRRIDAELARPS